MKEIRINKKTKFAELSQGELFISPDDDEIYMKVFGHFLNATTSEGTGGHAVLLKEGLICYFEDFEEVDKLIFNNNNGIKVQTKPWFH